MSLRYSFEVRSTMKRIRSIPNRLSPPMRAASSTAPSRPPRPPPRPFQSPSAEERASRRQAYEEATHSAASPASKPGISWPWPFSSRSSTLAAPAATPSIPQPTFYNSEPKDPQRGLDAARRAIVTGKLDPRYRGARNRVLAIIVGLPFVLVLSYELLERRFYGKEQKVRKTTTVVGQGEQQGSEDAVVLGRVLDGTGEKR